MDTPIATSNDENLPGVPFSERILTDTGGGSNPRTSNGAKDFGGGSWTIRWVETTGSTNADLLQAALDGAPHRLVLVADHQSAGRGRLDRTWEAQSGANLLMSVLIREVPAFPHQLTQAVAVAAAETCEAVGHILGRRIDVDLKWPNDVLIDGRKLAGILASAGTLRREKSSGATVSHADGPDFVVVGLGLNIGWAPEGAVCLIDALGRDSPVPGTGMRDQVLEGILERLGGLLEASTGEIFDRYRARLGTVGKNVRAHLPTGEILEGRVLDVETDGRLVVLDACAVTHRLDVGDIVHLR